MPRSFAKSVPEDLRSFQIKLDNYLVSKFTFQLLVHTIIFIDSSLNVFAVDISRAIMNYSIPRKVNVSYKLFITSL